VYVLLINDVVLEVVGVVPVNAIFVFVLVAVVDVATEYPTTTGADAVAFSVTLPPSETVPPPLSPVPAVTVIDELDNFALAIGIGRFNALAFMGIFFQILG
jgi:hypothetical protein